VFGALAFLPACGAILDFPDTREDNNYPSDDGAITNDGQIPGDGELADGAPIDGSTSSDGGSGPETSIPIDAGPPCGGSFCYGGKCTDNHCEPVSFEKDTITDPRLIAVDAITKKLYVASGTNSIYEIAADGTVNTTPLVSSESYLSALKADNGIVYFANSAGGTNARVSSCTASSCTATRHDFLTPTSGILVGGMIVDASKIYWTENASSGGLWACTLPSGTCTREINTPYVGAIFENTVGTTTSLFWADGITPNGIYSCTTAGFTRTPPANFINGVVDITHSGSSAYAVTSSALSSVADPVSSSPVAPITSGMGNIAGVVSDANNLYWMDATGGAGTLYTCSLPSCGTTVRAIIGGLPDVLAQPGGMAVSADSVYFTEQMDDEVWRVGK
jgi:hypothetical protein